MTRLVRWLNRFRCRVSQNGDDILEAFDEDMFLVDPVDGEDDGIDEAAFLVDVDDYDYGKGDDHAEVADRKKSSATQAKGGAKGQQGGAGEMAVAGGSEGKKGGGSYCITCFPCVSPAHHKDPKVKGHLPWPPPHQKGQWNENHKHTFVTMKYLILPPFCHFETSCFLNLNASSSNDFGVPKARAARKRTQATPPASRASR